MAYTGTLCTEEEIAIFAGENIDATGNTEANHNSLVAMAEATICAISRYNWVDAYATLNEDIKRILAEYCARSAATALISYNMAGYTSRIEAEDMLNICIYRIKNIEKILADQKVVDFLKGA